MGSVLYYFFKRDLVIQSIINTGTCIVSKVNQCLFESIDINRISILKYDFFVNSYKYICLEGSLNYKVYN